MDSRELSEWIAYDNIEPFEDGYWQAAMIASVLVNSQRVKGPRAKITDFLPVRRDSRKRQTPAELESAFRAFAIAHNTKKAANGHDRDH